MLGLDIGSSVVRVVGLERGMSGQFVLAHCGSERLQPGWIMGDSVEKMVEVANSVKRAVTQSGAKTKNVVMALPASAVVTKTVNIQADLNDNDFEAQVESEISSYLPWALDEVNIDYVKLNPVIGTGEVEVLVAAARKDKVEEWQTIAEAAGLKVAILEVGAFVRARMVCPENHSTNEFGTQDGPLVANLKMGSVSTSLQVYQNGMLIFDRDLNFGGSQLTNLIESHYGLSATDAERKKRSRDLPAGYESSVIAPYLANTALEIERGVQFFHSASGRQRISKIVLSGGGSCITGLSRAVSSQTGIACELASPFEGMTIKSEQINKRLRREAPAYHFAAGLAMRRFLA